MRHAWYIAQKDLLENRRDRLAALFTIVLPVIFTIFLGLIIGSADNGKLPVAIADSDGSVASQQLVQTLGQSPSLQLKTTAADAVDKAVQNQDVAAGLIIPKGYGAAITVGQPIALTVVRVQTSSGGQSVWQVIEQTVADVNVSMLAARTAAQQVASAAGVTMTDSLITSARSLADAALASPTISVQETSSAKSGQVTAGGFDQSSSGSLVNWVLFSLLGIGTAMVWERRQGLLRRLSVAGITAPEIISGKMISMLIITFLQQLLLILLGQLAFHVHYFNSPAALLLVMVSLSMLAASFGLLISVAFKSEQAVIATTVISAQLLAAVGGAWFPLEITGATFNKVAHFLPSAWVMDSLHGIILKDWGIAQVLHPMGIVWAWIVVLFALALWRYRPDTR